MTYAVVGAGPRARAHVRVGVALREERIVDEVVVCEANEGRARELAHRHDVGYCTAVDDLSATVATVAGPPAVRESLASSLLESGADVLVETPITRSSDRARDLVETARANDVTLGAARPLRYQPAIDELARRIDRGELGPIRYLHATHATDRAPRTAGDVLHTLAVHDLDVYRHLVDGGDGAGACRIESIVDGDESDGVTVVCAVGEAAGVVNAVWQPPGREDNRHLVVAGADRTAVVDYDAPRELAVFDTAAAANPGGVRDRPADADVRTVDGTEPLKALVIEFLHATETGAAAPVSGADAADLLAVVESAPTDLEYTPTEGSTGIEERV